MNYVNPELWANFYLPELSIDQLKNDYYHIGIRLFNILNKIGEKKQTKENYHLFEEYRVLYINYCDIINESKIRNLNLRNKTVEQLKKIKVNNYNKYAIQRELEIKRLKSKITN